MIFKKLDFMRHDNAKNVVSDPVMRHANEHIVGNSKAGYHWYADPKNDETLNPHSAAFGGQRFYIAQDSRQVNVSERTRLLDEFVGLYGEVVERVGMYKARGLEVP